MKNLFLTLLISLFFIGCKEKISEKDLAKINGYWEIEKAVMPDGEKKEYKVNTTIDFFNIKEGKGFRKKVMPQLDGKFLMNDLSENIKVDFKDDTVYLFYNTPYAKWKEEVLELSDSKLVVRNEQDIEYYYKRPQKFSLK